MKPKLIVEGKEDARFLQDVVKFHFDIDLVKEDFVFINNNAYSLPKENPRLRRLFNDGYQLICIMDADKDFQSSSNAISEFKQTQGMDFEHFLFPNNSAVGNLESLQQQLIPEKFRPFEICIDDYINCVNEQREQALHLTEKSKMFIYGSSSQSASRKGRDRSYLNEF